MQVWITMAMNEQMVADDEIMKSMHSRAKRYLQIQATESFGPSAVVDLETYTYSIEQEVDTIWKMHGLVVFRAECNVK